MNKSQFTKHIETIDHPRIKKIATTLKNMMRRGDTITIKNNVIDYTLGGVRGTCTINEFDVHPVMCLGTRVGGIKVSDTHNELTLYDDTYSFKGFDAPPDLEIRQRGKNVRFTDRKGRWGEITLKKYF